MWLRALHALQLILFQHRLPLAPVILPPGLALHHPLDIIGSLCRPPHLPEVQVQHPLLPLPLSWGGGPTCPITLPPSGGPRWRTSPCLGWQTWLAHPIACPAPVVLPPGLALASFGLPLQVMTTVPLWLVHHTAITKDTLTLLLGNPTRRVMMTIPSVGIRAPISSKSLSPVHS